MSGIDDCAARILERREVLGRIVDDLDQLGVDGALAVAVAGVTIIGSKVPSRERMSSPRRRPGSPSFEKLVSACGPFESTRPTSANGPLRFGSSPLSARICGVHGVEHLASATEPLDLPRRVLPHRVVAVGCAVRLEDDEGPLRQVGAPLEVVDEPSGPRRQARFRHRRWCDRRSRRAARATLHPAAGDGNPQLRARVQPGSAAYGSLSPILIVSCAGETCVRSGSPRCRSRRCR